MKKTTLLVFIAASLGFASVAHAESAKSLLNNLPKSLRENSQTIFSANTVGQLSLNSQYKKNSLENLCLQFVSTSQKLDIAKNLFELMLPVGHFRRPGLLQREQP